MLENCTAIRNPVSSLSFYCLMHHSSCYFSLW